MKKHCYLLLAFSCWRLLLFGQSFDPILAAKLQNTVDSFQTAYTLKGISASVIYPGQGMWQGVSGVSHAGVPITTDMEFAIASNTKLFTGVLVLKLVDSGLLQLDDSLYEYLPTYTNIDSTITIRQLLNHTSGLDDVTSVPGYPDSILNDPNRIFTASELMTWAGPPLFAPGTDWSYCNTNYLLAALIAESVTGQSYGRLLRDSILTPLQLDSTFLDVYDSVLYAVAHPWQGGMDFVSTPRISLNSAAWSAGAMYSTSGEMAQWYQALMGGQVLTPHSFQEMTTFVGSGNYGVGISEANFFGRTVWQHGGNIWGGYNSSMMYDTTSGIIIAVFINQLPAQAFMIARQLLFTLAANPLGVNENTLDHSPVVIFPNPATDLVTINLPSSSVRNVKVFRPSGELLQEHTATHFSISTLGSGMYVVAVTTESGPRFYKLLKQ